MKINLHDLSITVRNTIMRKSVMTRAELNSELRYGSDQHKIDALNRVLKSMVQHRHLNRHFDSDLSVVTFWIPGFGMTHLQADEPTSLVIPDYFRDPNAQLVEMAADEERILQEQKEAEERDRVQREKLEEAINESGDEEVSDKKPQKYNIPEFKSELSVRGLVEAQKKVPQMVTQQEIDQKFADNPVYVRLLKFFANWPEGQVALTAAGVHGLCKDCPQIQGLRPNNLGMIMKKLAAMGNISMRRLGTDNAQYAPKGWDWTNEKTTAPRFAKAAPKPSKPLTSPGTYSTFSRTTERPAQVFPPAPSPEQGLREYMATAKPAVMASPAPSPGSYVFPNSTQSEAEEAAEAGSEDEDEQGGTSAKVFELPDVSALPRPEVKDEQVRKTAAYLDNEGRIVLESSDATMTHFNKEESAAILALMTQIVKVTASALRVA